MSIARNAAPLAACMMACGLAAAQADASQPNILFIMADDLGPEWIGAYGAEQASTPHIDALAERGMLFHTAWCTPVCAPTRMMVMTGRNAARTGYYNHGDRAGAIRRHDPRHDFTEHEVTFGNLLRDAGYRTAIAGKWQLQVPMHIKIPAAGFDDFAMWQISHTPGHGASQQEIAGVAGNAGSRYFHPSVNRNGELLVTEPDDFGPDIYAQLLLDHIAKDPAGPWLAYFSMALPHSPLGPTPMHPDVPYGGSDETLAANVEYMDHLVGRLVDLVDSTGQRGNTLIIFTTDNGTARAGLKNSPTEAGARAPFIASWPGVIPEGVETRAMISFLDVLPTFLDAAGLPVPNSLELDGWSFLPVLRGDSDEHRDFIYSYVGQFRLARTNDWLIEFESDDYAGDLYFCGGIRDGAWNCLDVTDYDHPDVHAAREMLVRRLDEALPRPETTPDERMEFVRHLENLHGEAFDLRRVYPEEFRAATGLD